MIIVQHNNDGSIIFERKDDLGNQLLLIRFSKREVEDIIRSITVRERYDEYIKNKKTMGEGQ